MRKIKSTSLPRKLRADLRMQMKMLLAEVLPRCSAGSNEFNAHAIAWIEKNGARFRKTWDRYHNGRKEYGIGN